MDGRNRSKLCPDQLTRGVCVLTGCPCNHNFLVCEPCGVVCPSRYSYDQHLKGKYHQRQRNGPQYAPGTDLRHCSLCDRDIEAGAAWSAHVRGKYHNRHQRFVPLRQVLEDSEKDKHGITVETRSFDIGVLDVSEINREKVLRATVRNSVPGSNVVLVQCRITSKINGRHDAGYASLPSRE